MSSGRVPLGLELPPTERETEYSPSTRLPSRDLQPFLDDYRARSDEAHLSVPARTVRYGPEPSNTSDLGLPSARPTGSAAPLHVFIHGGYWQQLSKLDSYFPAPACIGRGQAFAAVDYTLAPAATVDVIVDECVAALRHLRSIAADHGLDPGAITVSGSSAGAHLAAMATGRLAPAERPAGLILVSGVYDIEPLVGTSINDALGLDRPAARALSPLLLPVDGFPPTVVAFGDDETDEFKRQSRAMTDRLTAAGVAVAEHEIPGRNHFDVVFDIVPLLADELDALGELRP